MINNLFLVVKSHHSSFSFSGSAGLQQPGGSLWQRPRATARDPVRPGHEHRNVVRQTGGQTDRYLPAHEVLQHRALPGALPAHHRDLRQVQARVLPDGGERVLQLVDQRDQLLHAPVPHDGETGGETDRWRDGGRERQTGGGAGGRWWSSGRQTGSSETGTVQQRTVAPSSCLTSSRSDRSADESDQMIDNQSDINKMMMMMMVLLLWPSAPLSSSSLLRCREGPAQHTHTSGTDLRNKSPRLLQRTSNDARRTVNTFSIDHWSAVISLNILTWRHVVRGTFVLL